MSIIAALLLAGANSPQTPPKGVFKEPFNGAKLSPGWREAASAGNSITVGGGVLRLAARRNTFANVLHPIGVDLVTAQCRIKPAPAESWATSIFLYWGTGDWCQLGVRPSDGGRVYMAQMANGIYSESMLGPAPFDSWHSLKIELGRNVLRFYSDNGKAHWKLEAFTERPATFDGAPTQLIVGKGYGGIDGYLKPFLANDYADRGEVGTSLIDDVVVTRTTPAKVNANSEELASWAYRLQDGLGREMLARPGGPTFEAVARRLPGILRPREVVGVPEHPHDFGVGWDATIQLKDWLGDQKMPEAYFEIGDPPVRIGSPTVPVSKQLPPGGAPVVIFRFEHEGVKFVGRVFGWSEGMSPDKPLSAYLTVAATSQSREPHAFRLRLNMTPAPSGWSPIEWNGEAVAGKPARFAARADRGEQWSGFTQVPSEEVASRLGEYVKSWESRLGSGLQLQTPERRVNDSFHAWMAYNYLNVSKLNGVFEIHDGRGFYDQIFAYSAFLFCNALDLYGHYEDAEKYIDSLLTFQHPDGLLTINYGLPDMGAMLLTMSQHHRFTGDDAWLRRVSPNMLKACHWLLSMRKTACLQPKKSVTYGMIKFKPYCDYPDPSYSYLSDAYVVVGLEATAREFRSIGLKKDADRIEKAAVTYRQDILRSMDRAKIVRDGLPILDMEPETHRLLKRSQYKGGEYYGLVAPSLLETGFLAPNDRRTRWITDFMEQRGGFFCGMSQFADGVDHAYTYGYWLTCLEQGRPDRAVLGLYGSMAGAISRDTFAGVEVMHILTGMPEGTLPHTYSGTQQLRLLRMMVLREDGENLEIGQAIPRGWMEDGKSIKVEHAPTLFGPVDVSYTSLVETGRAVATITPTFREKPARIRLWFRNPGHMRIRSATVNGKPYRDFDGEALTLRATGRPTTVAVQF